MKEGKCHYCKEDTDRWNGYYDVNNTRYLTYGYTCPNGLYTVAIDGELITKRKCFFDQTVIINECNEKFYKSFFKNSTQETNSKTTKEHGVKYDGEKPRCDLFPLDTLVSISKVLTVGAKKYSDNNWKKVENGYERYKAALLRHLAAIDSGEVDDPETGLPHVYHVGACVVFMIWIYDNLINQEVKVGK